MGRDAIHYIRLLQASSNLSLSISRDGAFMTWQLVPVPHYPFLNQQCTSLKQGIACPLSSHGLGHDNSVCKEQLREASHISRDELNQPG